MDYLLLSALNYAREDAVEEGDVSVDAVMERAIQYADFLNGFVTAGDLDDEDNLAAYCGHCLSEVDNS